VGKSGQGRKKTFWGKILTRRKRKRIKGKKRRGEIAMTVRTAKQSLVKKEKSDHFNMGEEAEGERGKKKARKELERCDQKPSQMKT